MADESITQNEDGYELLAVLVFILGTPLGLLLYEKGGETEHVRVEFLVFPPLYAERWLVIVTELYGQIAVHADSFQRGIADPFTGTDVSLPLPPYSRSGEAGDGDQCA